MDEKFIRNETTSRPSPTSHNPRLGTLRFSKTGVIFNVPIIPARPSIF